jgi:hypothetical protein
MKKRATVGVLLLLTSLLIIGCGGGSGGSSNTAAPSSGSVAVVLADGPADEYTNIFIWVTEVSLIPSEGNSSPVNVFRSNRVQDGHRGVKVDLLAYRDEDFPLTFKSDIPAGTYSKVRLEISAIEPIGGPCELLDVKLPSGKIDLNPREPFQVTEGNTLLIRLDVDANKSINLHEAGASDKCIFRPVVFVDIAEGEPIARCFKMVGGTIQELNDAGFVLSLDEEREFQVELTEQTAVFDEDGNFTDAGALATGQEVKVLGKMDSSGVIVASLVVIGDLLEVVGDVESTVQNNVFHLAPDSGEEITDPSLDVRVQQNTFIGLNCDTSGTSDMIVPGTRARVFGKFGNGVLSAAAIVLDDRKVTGNITAIANQEAGKLVTIQEADNTSIQVMIPSDTPTFLGSKQLSANNLCVNQTVRVVLEPGVASPLEAKTVFIQPERRTGRVVSVNTAASTLLVVDTATNIQELVNVPIDAKILNDQGDEEQKELISFGDIMVNDDIAYFGLPACQNDGNFTAYVIIVVNFE